MPLVKFLTNTIMNALGMSRKPQQQTSMAPARRSSIDSQEDSWSSHQPLVANSDKEKQDENQILVKSKYRQRLKILWIHLFLITFYTFAFFVAIDFWNFQESRYLAYSPASEVIHYQKISYDGKLDGVGPYRGKPRPELEQAWHDLLANNNIRLSKDELKKLNKTSIELHDGSGYLGELGVYHHLHCLKFLRQVLYSDYYDVNTPDRQMHADHCVEVIRHALMCHADTAVVTYSWRPDTRRPWPDFSVDQTCVDWDALDSWAAERSFSAFDQKSLVHPELGIAFPIVNESMKDMLHEAEIA